LKSQPIETVAGAGELPVSAGGKRSEFVASPLQVLVLAKPNLQTFQLAYSKKFRMSQFKSQLPTVSGCG
jgi:hypothetical protein